MNEVYRREMKYLMNLVDMQRLSARLDSVLHQDPHNGAQGYWISSLYFDTLDDGDFVEKLDGIANRRKIRLRIYDPDAAFAMLEMKQKAGDYQKKRSLRLSRADAEEVAAGRYDCLLSYPDPFAAECYGLMHRKCYRPVTIIAYRRKAYILSENQTRITLDQDIRATEAHLQFFVPPRNLAPVLDPFNAVLEVKYNGFLLSYVKDLVSTANRSPLSVSKYALARSAGKRFAL